MEKIIFEKAVLEYFDDLVFALFEDEYFGFLETAQDYINKIVGFVISSISSFPHKKTPKSIQYLGSNYFFIKLIPEQLGMSSLRKEIKII